MWTLLSIITLLASFAATAEPKMQPKPSKATAAVSAPLAAPAPAVAQPAFEAKAVEIAAPAIEIKTRELGAADLDRRLSARRASQSTNSDASVLRAPPKAPTAGAASTN